MRYLDNEATFPLNEDGTRKTYDELLEYISKLPLLESPLRLEDVAEHVDGTIEEWAKNNGLISLRDYAAKRGVNLDED